MVQVGKGAVPAAQAVGEFIGLAHFSPAGALALSKIWQDALDAGGLSVCGPRLMHGHCVVAEIRQPQIT